MSIAIEVRMIPTNSGVIFNVSIFSLCVQPPAYKSIAEKTSKAVAKTIAAVNLVLSNIFIFYEFI